MKNCLIIIILLWSALILAQHVEQIEQQMLSIQSQPDVYYFGYAEGRQRKETDQEALKQLMSQIYVVISSELTSTSVEDTLGNYDQKLEKVMETYTYGRLSDVKQLSYKKGPIFHVFRYIKRDEYKKIFENKKVEIRGFLGEAQENLKTNQLGKVFRNYYRAAVAIEGLQDGCVDYEGKVYYPETLFAKIREIAKDIEIVLSSNIYENDTRYIALNFIYNNQPVEDLNILYYDLHDFIPQKTNSNMVYIQLYGKEYANMDMLSLKIDLKEDMYSSYNEQTKILSRLFECEELDEYREIILEKRKIKKVSKKKRVIPEFNIEFVNSANCNILDEFGQNLITLISMLEYEYIDNTTIFSDSKIAKRMEQVVDCTHTKLLDYPQKIYINKTDCGWEAREFSVSVSCEGFPTRNETVVIDFDDDGKIYNFCYTINPALHELFETQGTAAGDWDYRQIAIKFLENYKTSYTTKNIEDIETLYSDDAIIITGKVIKRTKLDNEISNDFSEDEIVYFKKTKQEHIASQKKVFENNRFVWLQFDTFNINAAPIDSVYGVSMKQNYYSSTYKDEGYLFLLIDFRGESPLIHVRNWQPGEWDLSKQMKLENFRFY